MCLEKQNYFCICSFVFVSNYKQKFTEIHWTYITQLVYQNFTIAGVYYVSKKELCITLTVAYKAYCYVTV